MTVSGITFPLAVLGALVVARPAISRAADAVWMPRAEDTTQLWWVDGPPRVANTNSRPASATLCFAFGGKKLLFDTRSVRPVEGVWECALVADGVRFVCTGHAQPKDEFLQPVRFVETGRFFQRVVIAGLEFADAKGQKFSGSANLEISAWPDRLAFRLVSDTEATLELVYGKQKATGVKSVLLAVVPGGKEAVVESELPVTLDEDLGCHRIALPGKPWSNRSGTPYPEEHLDRVDRWRVTLRNDSDSATVARVMVTQDQNLPVTGFTPMLCDPDGTPTGLPVQVSKNWHRRPEKGSVPHEGMWFHGFVWVRVPPRSKREFAFQMVYARYGGVCAASHAQLCLIGWGHNQFWDEAAVGSFGESICFEPGRVQRRCFITDIRPLMTLPHSGSGHKPWGWAENGGGGDFLMWEDDKGLYRPVRGTRVDYRAHGPCLTDVRYAEETVGGEISARMDVSIPAANDYLRTFIRLRYDVRQPVKWRRLAFFQLGADYYNEIPARRVAVGDIKGVREDWELRQADNAYDRPAMPLTGESPWVSVHGLARNELKKGHAAASRGLIVRSWRAVLGGKPAGPHAAFYGNGQGKKRHRFYRTVAELSPPPDVVALQPGDFVEAELELVMYPTDAAAYYGPESTFREALARDADTWKLVHREAAGNALEPIAERGKVVKPYPLVVAVDAEQRAKLKVKGGLGHIPMTFTGLTQPRGHRLRVAGKVVEPWQTDWNPETQRWQVVYNVAPPGARAVDVEFDVQP
jgi:hypothetical protein